jgi:aminoglycoside 6'-N-acetyltransferase I
LEIKLLGQGDEHLLGFALPDLFDHEIAAKFLEEFLADPRHHLVAAFADAAMVGFVSAVHYVHPDKRPELWINEVSVAPMYRNRGVATAMLEAFFKVGSDLGCGEAWVLTDRANTAAMQLYSAFAPKPPSDHVMFTFPLRKE